MFVSFHHSSWNLYVRFLFTESAICRNPPDKLKIMSNGYGVNSAITAHSGFWLFRDFFGPMITLSRYLNKPSTVCWLPQAWDIVGHSQSYSEIKSIIVLLFFFSRWTNPVHRTGRILHRTGTDSKFTINGVLVAVANYQAFPSGPNIIQGRTQTFDPSIGFQNQAFEFSQENHG